MIQIFKILNGLDDLHSSDFFQQYVPGHEVIILKLRKPYANSNVRQGNFSHRVVDLWNSLPPKVINSNSINTFKSNLEKSWKHKFNCFNPNSHDAPALRMQIVVHITLAASLKRMQRGK